MSAIKKAVTPWLIAENGINYADWDNIDTTTLMVEHVIVMQQICSYTVCTFSAGIDGHHVKQVAFTKFGLRTVGNCSVPMFDSDEQPLTHCLISAKSNIVSKSIARIFAMVT
jgi:hypothetical protein